MDIKEATEKAKSLEGLKGLALVDANSGMCIHHETTDNKYNMEVVAASMASVLKQIHRASIQSKFSGRLKDMLLEFEGVYVTSTPLPKKPGVFGLLMLDRESCNLAMTRIVLNEIMKDFTF